MAQHWGGLHAITALFHNWLVSWRAQACQHAGRQAGRMWLQQLPQAGMRAALCCAVLCWASYVISRKYRSLFFCSCVFVCPYWTCNFWNCMYCNVLSVFTTELMYFKYLISCYFFRSSSIQFQEVIFHFVFCQLDLLHFLTFYKQMKSFAKLS